MSDAHDKPEAASPDEARPEGPDEAAAPDDTEPREMTLTTWGGNVLAPRDSGEEPGPEPPRRGRLGMDPMQWRYVLVMLVTGVSVVITLALFLLVIKLVAG